MGKKKVRIAKNNKPTYFFEINNNDKYIKLIESQTKRDKLNELNKRYVIC